MLNGCSLSDFCAFSGSSFLPQHENSAFPVPVNTAPHSGQTKNFILFMLPESHAFSLSSPQSSPFASTPRIELKSFISDTSGYPSPRSHLDTA